MVKLFIGVFALALFFQQSFSQESVAGCSDLQASDFSGEALVKRGSGGQVQDNSLSESIQFDLDPIMSGDQISSVDAYIVERKGKVKYFNSASKTLTEIGTIDVRASHVGTTDYGLMGIALDPDFKTNNWVYMWYAPRTNESGQQYGGNDWKRMKLSRFTLNAISKQIDMNSEKVLIETIGNKSDDWHAGGPMKFDKHGDLWITVGNNSKDHGNGHHSNDSVKSDEWGASNTASFRGSILRIHPDDDAPKGYTIPKDNFGEYWANQFQSQGKTALAAEYRDPTKMLPEIYTKGHRSNFSIAVHPTKRWLAWGEVNFGSSLDEHNIVNHPVFAGYPYFHGNQQGTSGNTTPVAAPQNNSPISSGIVNLPPAHPPTFANLANVAITGAIYVYDSSLQSDVKFPPHFHEHWFNLNFGNRFFVAKVNSDGSGIVPNSNNDVGGGGKLLGALTLSNPIAARFGPDGAFYLMNYNGHYSRAGDNTGLYRLNYNGDCKPYKAPVLQRPQISAKVDLINGVLTIGEPQHQVSIYNLVGKEMLNISAQGLTSYNMNELQKENKIENGLYLVQVITDKGKFTRTVSMF